MTQHPSRGQLIEYRDRTLSPTGLVALDRQRRIAAITMATLALAVLSPLIFVKRTETARREFAENLRSNSPWQIPGLAAVLGLPPNADANVEYPVSEVVVETQPELRWKPFAASYLVSVFDSQHRMVAASAMLSDTHWRVPAQLGPWARPPNRSACSLWRSRNF